MATPARLPGQACEALAARRYERQRHGGRRGWHRRARSRRWSQARALPGRRNLAPQSVGSPPHSRPRQVLAVAPGSAVILLIDSGNSRMKWGLVGPRGWVGQGVVSNAELATLAVRDWQNLPRPARAIGVNVAGEAARVRVEGQLARWRLPIQWLTATAEAAG